MNGAVAMFLAAMLAIAAVAAHGYPHWQAPPDCICLP